MSTVKNFTFIESPYVKEPGNAETHIFEFRGNKGKMEACFSSSKTYSYQ